MATIHLSKFNMRSIPVYDKYDISNGKKLVFIGQSGSGKTKLIVDFLANHSDFPYVVCISPSEDMNKTFSPHIPQIFIHKKYSTKLIKDIMQRQRKLIRKIKQNSKYKDVDPRLLLILDDCLHDSTWTKDPFMREIFFAGRHYRITLLLAMQYALGMPPEMRTNIDYVFLSHDPKKNNLRKIHEYYAGVIEKYPVFQRIFYECTEDYRAMVIDCHAQSKNVKDSIYWYKARIDHGNFKMCIQYGGRFWNLNSIIEQIKEQEEIEELEDDDEDDIQQRKNKDRVLLI
jgi:hypothetical protein